MAYFTSEQIAKAKEIDLLTYLQNNNPDELVYESRETYHTRTHDSLKINNGMWYWFSRCIGGKTALEYLIQVEEMSFTQAVGHLLKQNGLEKKTIPISKLTEKEKIEIFNLPKKANSNYKVKAYLMARGISKNIIDECINKDLIYQEFSTDNVVFVGYDENNTARYASIRATNLTRFMHEAYGSDKAYSFKLKSTIQNNSLHLFESAIDLLSYATIKELKNEKWDEENLLSLAGVYNSKNNNLSVKIPVSIEKFLSENKNIDTIYTHFDNDEAGRLATKSLQNSLSASYKIIDNPAPVGKDFNDYLCNILKINYKRKTQFDR